MININSKLSPIKNIAFIGNHLPRRCGIATFTSDLAGAIAHELADSGTVEAVAMDDLAQGYAYPDQVKFQIAANSRPDYDRAADFLNLNQFDLVVVQHEYGIFGGQDGSHLLPLLEALNMPVICTLHTVLEDPSPGQHRVLMELARLCDRLVVMSHRAEAILRERYQLDAPKVAFVPHGIPDVPFGDPSFHKDLFGVERNKVILSFGLLGPSKGIETMIEAMPRVVTDHPDAVYLILGATHPHVIRHAGESYRQSLVQQARRLGIDDHVRFHNRFVTLDELCQYLNAADVYCTPYPHPEQIASGTLAYACGCGKAVVSTPYWYAQEMLADERGMLVDFDDPAAMGAAIAELLADDHARNAMRKRAYTYCRDMVWKEVARRYLDLGADIFAEYANAPRPRQQRRDAAAFQELPLPQLDHLRRLTDDVGLLRYARYTVPDRRHGYACEDNALAVVATCMAHARNDRGVALDLVTTYLAFLLDAFDETRGGFRGHLSYARRWSDEDPADDTHGRTVWALGAAVHYQTTDEVTGVAAALLATALPACEHFTSPRAIAYALIGIHNYLSVYRGDSDARRLRQLLADRLFEHFADNDADDAWPWLEDTLGYANAVIPHALLLCGQWMDRGELFDCAMRTLRWLVEVQSTPAGHLSLVGNESWMRRDGHRAHFDQQPIEAMNLLLACREAYNATGEATWLDQARRCLDWFLGRNDLAIPLCSFRDGGCHDVLQVQGVNNNQGAEATVAWLISILAMHEIAATSPVENQKPAPATA